MFGAEQWRGCKRYKSADTTDVLSLCVFQTATTHAQLCAYKHWREDTVVDSGAVHYCYSTEQQKLYSGQLYSRCVLHLQLCIFVSITSQVHAECAQCNKHNTRFIQQDSKHKIICTERMRMLVYHCELSSISCGTDCYTVNYYTAFDGYRVLLLTGRACRVSHVY